MEKINFSTDINASSEKVWKTLWNDDSYREWTSIFMEGSYVKTDNWKEGTKVLFLDPKGSGMVSKIAANKPNKFMSFEHLGVVKDGVEDTESDSVKEWAGAKENYTLKEEGGKTKLIVDLESTDDFKDYFLKTFPLALDKVKELAEKKLIINKNRLMQKITPFLWFDGKTEEAVKLYTSLFKNSKVISIAYWGEGSPFPKDQVMTAVFELDGQQFYAFDAGPQFKFTEAISFYVNCETQEEIDHFWNGFIKNGGQESQCGWLKDKFGISWQIVPPILPEMLNDKNKSRAGRVMQAMMGMKKIIIADLKKAYDDK